jgi:hypothetical protein
MARARPAALLAAAAAVALQPLATAATGLPAVRSVSVIAGRGLCVFDGDGGPATAAGLAGPSALVYLGGNLTDPPPGPDRTLFVIADAVSSNVRIINASGLIGTVIGVGNVSGFGGDGGFANAALLNEPRGLAVPPQSGGGGASAFVADRHNNRVRMMQSNSTGMFLDTVVGTGTQGGGGDGGPAAAATLDNPWGVALFGPDAVLISDMGSRRVRRAWNSGQGGTPQIAAFAGDGVYASAGDGGPATSASMTAPTGVLFTNGTEAATLLRSPGGVVFIVDSASRVIRYVNTTAGSGRIWTLAGNGAIGRGGDGGYASAASFVSPSYLAFDARRNVLYVSDTGAGTVRAITIIVDAGCPLRYPGCLGGIISSLDIPDLRSPTGLALTPDGGALFVAESTHTCRLLRVVLTATPTPSPTPLASPSVGASPASTQTPTVTASPSGTPLTGTVGDAVVVAGGATCGCATDDGVAATTAALGAVSALLYVGGGADGGTGLDPALSGTPSSSATVSPTGSATRSGTPGASATPGGTWNGGGGGGDGLQLVLVDRDGNVVRGLYANGTLATLVGVPCVRGYGGDGSPSTLALLSAPEGIAFLEGGGGGGGGDNNGGSSGGSTPSGTVVATAVGSAAGTASATSTSAYTGGGGGNNNNGGGGGGGSAFISDAGNFRLRMVQGNGNLYIDTVVGNGTAERSGDGGPASAARVAALRGVTGGGSNQVFFIDGNTVRRGFSNATGGNATVELVAGNGTAGFGGVNVSAPTAMLYSPTSVLWVNASQYPALGGAGEFLLIADSQNKRIRYVNLTTRFIFTVFGAGTWGTAGDGGLPLSASLQWPTHMAFHGERRALYVADADARAIRVAYWYTNAIAAPGYLYWGVTATLPVSVTLTAPGALALGGPSLYVADGCRVLRVNLFPSASPSASVPPSSSASPSASQSTTGTPPPTPSTSGSPPGTPSRTGSPTGTPSPSGTPTGTPSPSGTPTGTPPPTPSRSSGYCPPGAFTAAPHTSLAGEHLPGSGVSLSSEAACRLACCDAAAAGCTGYTLSADLLQAAGVGVCHLFVNVSQLVPVAGYTSAVLTSAIPAS